MMANHGMNMVSGMRTEPSFFLRFPIVCIFVLEHACCVYTLRLPAFGVLRRMYQLFYKCLRMF